MKTIAAVLAIAFAFLLNVFMRPRHAALYFRACSLRAPPFCYNHAHRFSTIRNLQSTITNV